MPTEDADFRTNAAGDALALQFTTTTAQFRQTWAAVMEQNLAGCGIQMIRLHAPASWWFGDTTGLARRDFEMGAFAWVGEADPGGETLYACDQIPLPSNGWEGQNYMGWCNQTASDAIHAANNTLDKDERIAQYAIFQQEFAKDIPSLPLFNRVEVLATSLDLTGFEPAAGEPFASYNVHEWEIPGQDTIVMGYTQEPASLFQLVEDAFVARATRPRRSRAAGRRAWTTSSRPTCTPRSSRRWRTAGQSWKRSTSLRGPRSWPPTARWPNSPPASQ